MIKVFQLRNWIQERGEIVMILLFWKTQMVIYSV